MRGLATIFLRNLAGAIVAKGADLPLIAYEVRKAAELIASISVSASNCTMPDVGPSFTLLPNQLEICLGVHVGRGIQKVGHKWAQDLVLTLPIFPLLHYTGKKDDCSSEMEAQITDLYINK